MATLDVFIDDNSRISDSVQKKLTNLRLVLDKTLSQPPRVVIVYITVNKAVNRHIGLNLRCPTEHFSGQLDLFHVNI